MATARKSLVVLNDETPAWRQPVIAVPLTQAFPALGEVKEFKSKVCLFNHDRSRVYDVVSNRYKVIEHTKAVDLVTNSLETYFGKPCKADVRSLLGGSRILATFKLPGLSIKLAKNDINEIQIVLRNSYDRSWVFSAVLGAYRLVCSNGMMIGEEFGSLRARHTGLDQELLLPVLDNMIKAVPRLKNVWTEWADTHIEFDVAQALLEGRFPPKYLDSILDEDLYPMSKWELYNMLTRFATHDTKTIQRRSEFANRIASIFYGNTDVEDGELVEADE